MAICLPKINFNNIILFELRCFVCVCCTYICSKLVFVFFLSYFEKKKIYCLSYDPDCCPPEE